jgi:hypothetical protein
MLLHLSILLQRKKNVLGPIFRVHIYLDKWNSFQTMLFLCVLFRQKSDVISEIILSFLYYQQIE